MKLYVGDGIDVVKAMPPASVDVVITDPPYYPIAPTTANNKGSLHGLYNSYLKLALLEWKRVIKPDHAVVVFANHTSLFPTISAALGAFRHADPGVWDKGCILTSFSPFRRSCEYFVVAYDAYPFKFGERRNVPDVLSFPAINTHKRLIASEKPVPLLEQIIRATCRPGDTILDPFAGSGSIFQAAANTGREAIGCEIDPMMAQAIAKRIPAIEVVNVDEGDGAK